MIVDFQGWRHVFKLDPDRELSDHAIEQICTSATDAILVGGSSGLTYENTVNLLAKIRQYELPCVCEVSNAQVIVPGFDMYFIPVVLNAGHLDWIIGQHQQAIKSFGHFLNWQEIVTEGYIILNPQATVAQLTQARTLLEPKDVIAYAQIADRMFHMPIVYIEYSGHFGDMEILSKVKAVLHQAHLFYGGGIDSLEKAQQAARIAHTIVVGNIIYYDLEQALQTVKLS